MNVNQLTKTAIFAPGHTKVFVNFVFMLHGRHYAGLIPVDDAAFDVVNDRFLISTEITSIDPILEGEVTAKEPIL